MNDPESTLKAMIPGITSLKIIPGKEATFHIEATRTFNDIAVVRAVNLLLRGFGVDTRDENFKGTPERVTKLWKAWLAPTSLKMSVFTSQGHGMVTLTGHKTVSVCPHHLLPFHLRVDIAYIPQDYVLGLSKLPRLADLVSSAFVLQEHIPEVICRVLETLLAPKGVMCRTRGTHGCMRMRGVKTTGEVTCTAVRGVFLTDEKARTEFLTEVSNANEE